MNARDAVSLTGDKMIYPYLTCSTESTVHIQQRVDCSSTMYAPALTDHLTRLNLTVVVSNEYSNFKGQAHEIYRQGSTLFINVMHSSLKDHHM